MPALAPAPAPADTRRAPAAVLTGGCDGYRPGTTGVVLGTHEGCLVFAPDRPDVVARWARARPTLLVPPALVVVAG
jgi:hypothetical protein